MAGMAQRPGKKGRRSEREGGVVRANKTPAGDNLAHLLAPNPVEGGVYSNPPLAHTLVSLIGCVVEVQLASGEIYEGVLRAISPNMEISLNVAHVKGQPPTVESVYNRKEVRFADVVTISAKTGTNPQLDIFKTDSEISGHQNGPQSRELQPFTDFSEDANNLDMAGGSEGWSVEEMFAVNQNKFKVTSTYDDELPQYTTPLARDAEGYKKREMEAIQLANEIEARSMFSRRGVDDLGSEEDRWSSVLREPERSRGGSGGLVAKENGNHTPSHLAPNSQAPPISTPPSLIAPPTSSQSPSPSPLVPPSPQTDNSSVTAESEATPPAPPTKSPGNNQINSSDDVVATDESSLDNTNEGKPLVIRSEVDPESVHTSVGENSADTEESVSPAGEAVMKQPTSLQSAGGEGDVEKKEGGAPSSLSEPEKVAETEQAIKNFRLDPTAKEFVVPTSFLPSSLTSSTAPSAASLSTTYTHTRTHPHTPRSGGGTPRYSGNTGSPRVRPSAVSSSNLYSHLAFTTPDIHTAVSSSYMLSQQPTSMAGLLRPGLPAGFSQYAVPHGHLMGGVMPQIIASHSSMMGGGQQQFPLVQQPQLFQPTQPIVTPQGIVMPAAAQPAVYMGGVPLSPLHHQQQMVGMAGGGVGQPSPAAMGQAIAGTTAASGLQRGVGHYQLPGAGK